MTPSQGIIWLYKQRDWKRKGRIKNPLPMHETKAENKERDVLDDLEGIPRYYKERSGKGVSVVLDVRKILVDGWQPDIEKSTLLWMLRNTAILDGWVHTGCTDEEHSRGAYSKPRALLLNGKYRILDGHTRAALSFLLGRFMMEFKLINCDAILKSRRKK